MAERRSRPGRRPGEWQVPMPKGAGPEEWALWLDSYKEEVAATGQPLATEEAVCAKFREDLELVTIYVRSAGGPPLWAVRHAAQGVRAVEAWLRAEGFPVRRAAREQLELADVLARLPAPGLLPDLLVGERHAFFLEVRRTSVTSAPHYSQRLGTGELGLDAERVEAFQLVEDLTGGPVFVLFLDEPLRRIHGNWLAELLEPRTLLDGRDHSRLVYPRRRPDRQRGRDVVYFPYPAAFRPLGTVASGRRFRLARGAQRDELRLSGQPEF